MWLLAAGVEGVEPTKGIRFKQTALVIQAAVEAQGVALGTHGLVADDLGAAPRPPVRSLAEGIAAICLLSGLAAGQLPSVR